MIMRAVIVSYKIKVVYILHTMISILHLKVFVGSFRVASSKV